MFRTKYGNMQQRLNDDFCRLMISFANSVDPYQARQTVGPHLDLEFRIPERVIFYKANLKQKLADDKSMQNCPACKGLNLIVRPSDQAYAEVLHDGTTKPQTILFGCAGWSEL